jgi:Spy/CpxP family protein refolding chaperone
MIKTLQLLFILMLSATVLSYAQTVEPTQADKAAQYTKTITDRSDKIVAKLGITDEAKYKRVLDAIVNQYRSINDIHDANKVQIADIKKQTGDDKDATAAKIKAANDELDQKNDKLHADYLAKLEAELTPEQVDKVKDEMTYNVLWVTYKAYLDEIPSLTDVQKAQIKTWLIEAREHAIDGESSEKKHGMFNKYKGRINNYLSAQGYDLKKETEEWTKRRNAASGKN